MSESDLGKPVPDSIDQRREVDNEPDIVPGGEPAGLPPDADEADAADQRREVELDEDDYR